MAHLYPVNPVRKINFMKIRANFWLLSSTYMVTKNQTTNMTE